MPLYTVTNRTPVRDSYGMPERDPTLWAIIASAINNHGLAAGMAFMIAYLRILYDDKEPRPIRRLLEAALGGAIVFIVGMTAENFGLHAGWTYATAGAIGVLGVDWVRTKARQWADKKVDR